MSKYVQIIPIENKPISSISYIVYIEEFGNCIIVDPGAEDPTSIDIVLIHKKLRPVYIIFTHEHFDHIWSANFFIQKYGTSIICSEFCANAIQNSKYNLSAFYDASKSFCIIPKTQIIAKDADIINWEGKKLFFKESQGHSQGGIIVLLENFIFTGDTLIKGIKTVTKLKGASRDKLVESIEFLKSLKGHNFIVCPGHGDTFKLDEYDLLIAL